MCAKTQMWGGCVDIRDQVPSQRQSRKAGPSRPRQFFLWARESG